LKGVVNKLYLCARKIDATVLAFKSIFIQHNLTIHENFNLKFFYKIYNNFLWFTTIVFTGYFYLTGQKTREPAKSGDPNH